MKSANHREPQPPDRERHLPPEAEFRSRLSWFVGVSDPAVVDRSALTYEPFFGLREKPFSLAADPRFFFTGLAHGVAFDALAAGIRRREGILVLTGEVGTGKTTLCRAVLQSLDRKTFAAYVADPFLSRDDLLKTLLMDFGVVSSEEIKRGALRGATRADLCYPLYEFLGSLVPLKAFAVVMIDEAQNLTPELLEEVRILSDLERGQKLLEVFLIGQPELEMRLADAAMRQLSQRVTIRCELPPLSREEAGLYVAHRLAVAGNDGRVRFTDAAIDEVYAASGGIPRVVNIVCDRALTHAAALQTLIVDAASVKWNRGDVTVPIAPPPAIALVHSQPERPRPLEAPLIDAVKETDSPAPESLVQMLSDVTTPPDSTPPVTSEAPFWPSTAEERSVAATGFERSTAPTSTGTTGMLIATVAVLVVAAVLGYRYWSAAPTPASPPVVAQPAAQPATEPPTQPAPQPSQPAPVTPGAPATVRPAPANGSASSTPASRFAILMATFQSDDRTAKSLQELRDAGFKPFKADVELRDGGHAQVVYLGPYNDRAEAERDLERARDVPGYDGGRIVPLKPSPRP